MTLQQRRNELIKQISSVKDEYILILLQEELSCYKSESGIIELSEKDRAELISLADEPAEKDTVSETEYLNATRRWRT